MVFFWFGFETGASLEIANFELYKSGGGNELLTWSALLIVKTLFCGFSLENKGTSGLSIFMLQEVLNLYWLFLVDIGITKRLDGERGGRLILNNISCLII